MEYVKSSGFESFKQDTNRHIERMYHNDNILGDRFKVVEAKVQIIESVVGDVKELEEKVSTVESEVADLKNDVGDLTEQVDDLEGDVATLGSEIDSLGGFTACSVYWLNSVVGTLPQNVWTQLVWTSHSGSQYDALSIIGAKTLIRRGGVYVLAARINFGLGNVGDRAVRFKLRRGRNETIFGEERRDALSVGVDTIVNTRCTTVLCPGDVIMVESEQTGLSGINVPGDTIDTFSAVRINDSDHRGMVSWPSDTYEDAIVHLPMTAYSGTSGFTVDGDELTIVNSGVYEIVYHVGIRSPNLGEAVEGFVNTGSAHYGNDKDITYNDSGNYHAMIDGSVYFGASAGLKIKFTLIFPGSTTEPREIGQGIGTGPYNYAYMYIRRLDSPLKIT
jgi:uncharacterized protein YoxC